MELFIFKMLIRSVKMLNPVQCHLRPQPHFIHLHLCLLQDIQELGFLLDLHLLSDLLSMFVMSSFQIFHLYRYCYCEWITRMGNLNCSQMLNSAHFLLHYADHCSCASQSFKILSLPWTKLLLIHAGFQEDLRNHF